MATAKIALKNGEYSTVIGVNGSPEIETPFNIPSDLGSSGMVLTTDGNGNLIWDWPVEAITGTYTFNNGLTLLTGNVKLGGSLVANTDTIISIPLPSSNSTTSFNIEDPEYASFRVYRENTSANNSRKSGLELNSGVDYVYNTPGNTQVKATNYIKNITDIYDLSFSGTLVSPFSYTNYVELDSTTFAAVNTKKSRVNLKLGSTGVGDLSTGDVGVPNLNLYLYDSTSDFSYNNLYFSSVSGLNITRSYSGNNILSTCSAKVIHSSSTDTNYNNLNCINQTYVFNPNKTGLGATTITMPAYKVLYDGVHKAQGNSDTLELKGLYEVDSLTRTVYSGIYPKVLVIPIDCTIDTTIGNTVYDKSVFKVNLTSDGDNYILDTYPILNAGKTAYSSVSATSALIRIRNNGSDKLMLSGDGSLGVNVSSTTVGNGYFFPKVAPSTQGSFMTFGANKTIEWNSSIRMNGTSLIVGANITAYSTLINSDISLKNNINRLNLNDSLRTICQLEPKSYEFNNEPGRLHYGLIAQEVEKILPELVYETDGIKSINYTELIALLIAAIKQINPKL